VAISKHAETFAGYRVKDYDPEKGIRPGRGGTPTIYRLGGLEYGEPRHPFPELLERFLQEPGVEKIPALVIGAWDYEDMLEGRTQDVIGGLVAARNRFPKLRALFLGDVIYRECEISWLQVGDVSPLLEAYPLLEHFRVRGRSPHRGRQGGLSLGALRLEHLRSLVVESGGLGQNVLDEVYTGHLPRLEHLELWLGDPEYGGISDPVPLVPLLRSRSFPKLRFLGLRNCLVADLVAQAIACAPILRQLKVLDLSRGALGDAGARALLASPLIRRLDKLDIHHHYVSPPVVKELKDLGIKVDASEPREAEDEDDGTEYRYIAASE
jgi:hypothetical protein